MRDPKLIQEKVNEFKRGELPDGSRIGYYRNVGYRNFKRNINPLASGTVDLILTGSFTRQLFVDDIRPSVFTFDSRDDKAGLLESKYSTDIWGINPDYWLKHQNDYIPELTKWFKKQLNV